MLLDSEVQHRLSPVHMKPTTSVILKQIGIFNDHLWLKHKSQLPANIIIPILLNRLRLVECFGLEGTFRGHLAQHPRSEQGHLPLDQVAQSAVQPDLECFQGWGIDHLSGEPVPVFHHPHCKFLPYIQSKSALL